MDWAFALQKLETFSANGVDILTMDKVSALVFLVNNYRRNQDARNNLTSCTYLILRHMLPLKSDTSYEKHEWRLLAELKYKAISGARNEGLLQGEFRPTENRLMPYDELSFGDMGGNPINEVIIGPKNDIPLETFRSLLHNRGRKGIEVKSLKYPINSFYRHDDFYTVNRPWIIKQKRH